MATAQRTERKQTPHAAGERPAFKVRDLALADFGRKEIRLAE